MRHELRSKFIDRLAGDIYAEAQGVGAIPRNWVVTVDGKLAFEGIGFDYNGEEWMKKAAQALRRPRARTKS